MSRFLIVHGTGGSPDINWFPWLKDALESQGHTVIVPKFPTPRGQNPDNWLRVLHDQGIEPDGDTTLIGHSIGATFLCHILNQSEQKVRQTVFVSPVMGEIGRPEYDDLNEAFYDAPLDWDRVRENMGEPWVLHGEDDPYVPLEHAEILAEETDARLTVIPGGGHLNAESGYTSFPELFAHLKSGDA